MDRMFRSLFDTKLSPLKLSPIQIKYIKVFLWESNLKSVYENNFILTPCICKNLTATYKVKSGIFLLGVFTHI